MRFVIDHRSSDPKQIMRAADVSVRGLARGAMLVADRTALAAQKAIRAQMAAQRLAKFRGVVRYTSDQKKNRARTRNWTARGRWRVGAAVYANYQKSPRTAGAFNAYTTGPVIIPKKGKWLAFPTDNVPKRAGRRKMTPALFRSSGQEGKYGALKFIPGPRAGVAYLVAEDVTVPGGNRSGVARGAREKRVASRVARKFVVMFILIKRTKRDIRFRPVEIVRREAMKIPKALEAALLQNQRRNVGASGAFRSNPVAGSQGQAIGRLVGPGSF